MKTRPLASSDLPALYDVLDRIELFPANMLADMTVSHLSGESDDIWLVCERDGTAIGRCYAAPEQLADRVWNMLAIGIHPGHQSSGAGTALTAHLEETLRNRETRLLIVDTSSSDSFTQARAFYTARGYEPEARIRDFWEDGDDKVTFRKML